MKTQDPRQNGTKTPQYDKWVLPKPSCSSSLVVVVVVFLRSCDQTTYYPWCSGVCGPAASRTALAHVGAGRLAADPPWSHVSIRRRGGPPLLLSCLRPHGYRGFEYEFLLPDRELCCHNATRPKDLQQVGGPLESVSVAPMGVERDEQDVNGSSGANLRAATRSSD